jgi:hypothetical protein
MKCLYPILSIILFAAVAVEGKNHSKIAGQRSFWVLLLGAAVMVHYLMAAVGGGAYYYMKPTLIIAWMCGIILCADVNTIRFPMLGLMSIAIVFTIVIRLVASQYSFFAAIFLEAMQYTRTGTVRTGGRAHLCRESFLFLRSRIPVVDIGDYASQFEKIGYYGPAFSKIFRDNLNRLALTPPRYIIHSFVDSPELAEIIRNQYSRKQCAPKYFVDYPPPCLYRHAVQGQ